MMFTMTFVVLIVVLLFGAISLVLGAEELVWVKDSELNFARRQLTSDVAEQLTFRVKRQNGNALTLRLEENKKLNPNAPVYTVVNGEKDATRLTRDTTVKPILDNGYYQDKKNGGVFRVECYKSSRGYCQRALTGTFWIDGESYDISPVRRRRRLRATGQMPHRLKKNVRQIQAGARRVVDYLQRPDDEQSSDERDIQLITQQIVSILKKQEGMENETAVYAVELAVVVDRILYQRFYSEAEPTDEMTKEQRTIYELQRYFSHIVNGISFRYEEIEDPALQMFVVISKYVILKDENGTLPYDVVNNVVTIDGTQAVDGIAYVNSLTTWVPDQGKLFDGVDHVMLFSGYDLYADSADATGLGLAGVAFLGAACHPSHKVSVQQVGDFFVTTTVAAHELGHNLGADHDGDSQSSCKTSDSFIMDPYVPFFTTGSNYSANPWKFSQCSVTAFKKFIHEKSCFLDNVDYWDKSKHDEFVSKKPGEIYTLTEQCQNMFGESAIFCTDCLKDDMCRISKCCKDGNCDNVYTPAAGSPCGDANDAKWCIRGKCVEREGENENDNSTSESPETDEEGQNPSDDQNEDDSNDDGQIPDSVDGDGSSNSENDSIDAGQKPDSVDGDSSSNNENDSSDDGPNPNNDDDDDSDNDDYGSDWYDYYYNDDYGSDWYDNYYNDEYWSDWYDNYYNDDDGSDWYDYNYNDEYWSDWYDYNYNGDYASDWYDNYDNDDYESFWNDYNDARSKLSKLNSKQLPNTGSGHSFSPGTESQTSHENGKGTPPPIAVKRYNPLATMRKRKAFMNARSRLSNLNSKQLPNTGSGHDFSPGTESQTSHENEKSTPPPIAVKRYNPLARMRKRKAFMNARSRLSNLNNKQIPNTGSDHGLSPGTGSQTSRANSPSTPSPIVIKRYKALAQMRTLKALKNARGKFSNVNNGNDLNRQVTDHFPHKGTHGTRSKEAQPVNAKRRMALLKRLMVSARRKNKGTNRQMNSKRHGHIHGR